jgi:hypothetical protein
MLGARAVRLLADFRRNRPRFRGRRRLVGHFLVSVVVVVLEAGGVVVVVEEGEVESVVVVELPIEPEGVVDGGVTVVEDVVPGAVVVVVELVVEVPVFAALRSQPVAAAVARASMATTGSSRFMSCSPGRGWKGIPRRARGGCVPAQPMPRRLPGHGNTGCRRMATTLLPRGESFAPA